MVFFYHWGEQKRQGQEGQDKGPVKEGRKEGREGGRRKA